MTQLKFHPDDTILKGDAFFSIELKDWDVDGDYDSSIGLYGWCFSPVIPRGVNVEWYIGGCLLTSVPLNIPRPDIFLRFSFNEQCGFHFRVSKYMLPPDGRLDVSLWGVDVDGQRARLPLGQVEFLNVSRPPLRYSERSRPLILTGAGRSGTSMIMNLLSFHPEIVIPGPPPHELRTATWLWQAAQVLSAPSNVESVGPDSFENYSPHILGYNPYRSRDWEKAGGGSGLFPWQESVLPNMMIDHFKRCVDDMTAAMGRAEGVYIAQKMSFSPLVFFVNNIYTSARVVLLVRDFRDAWLSARAFNRKRGSKSFGSEGYADDLEWLKGLSFTAQQLKAFHAKFGSDIFLMRYEDILSDRRTSLRNLLKWLELRADEALIEELVGRSADATKEFGVEHQTSASPGTNRWRTEFSDEERAISDAFYTDALAYFGYENT